MEKNKYYFKSLEDIKLHPFIRKFWIISFIIILFLIGILFLPWQQTIKGYGKVIAYNPTERNYYVLAPISGFIDKFYVKEEQFVKKGEILFSMVDLDPQYQKRLEKQKDNTIKQINNLKKDISLLENRLEIARKNQNIGIDIYNQKLSQINQKIKSLELKKIALQKNYEINKINYERIKKLYQEGIEAKRKLELAENKYVKAKVELNKINVDISIQKQNLNITNAEKQKFIQDTNDKIKQIQNKIQQSRVKLNSFEKKLIDINIKISKFKSSLIKAEKDGYVVRILKNDKNRLIKKGEKILLFAPKIDRRVVLLKIDSLHMPLVKEGLPVRIQFYGWPTLQIPGWPKINFGTFGGVIEKVDPISFEEGYFYAYVSEDKNEPWPDENQLKIGTQATCWVRLSVVPIWYEIWRIVNAFPPNMINPKKDENYK